MVSASDMLKAENKFGSITIECWDKNEVEFHVTITTKASNATAVEALLKNVSVNFSKSGNIISAKTKIEGNVKDEAKVINVDYIIHMPKEMKLNLEQEFGSISMPDEFNGPTSLSVRFGSLKGGNINSSLNLSSQFSSVTLGNVGNLKSDMEFSDKVVFCDIKNAIIKGKFSGIEAGNIQSFDLIIEHGKTAIKKCDNMLLDAKFSDITVDILTNSGETKALNYGNLTIKELLPNFTLFKINYEYSNVKVFLPSSASFNIEGTSSFGDITLNSAFKLTSGTSKENGQTKIISGSINGGGKGIMEFHGKFGKGYILKL
ncbi:MAG: hypothetical protein PUB21_08470 [Bacteroidales bacterium]|nr:hypothetical protein [Bacteroidales bacterium]